MKYLPALLISWLVFSEIIFIAIRVSPFKIRNVYYVPFHYWVKPGMCLLECGMRFLEYVQYFSGNLQCIPEV